MKICFVVESYPPSVGGIAISTQKLAEGLAAIGIKCVVISTRSSIRTPHLEENGNLKVVRVFVPPFLLRWWFMAASLPVVYLHGQDSDVIQGSTYGGVLPAFFGSLLLNKKSVLMVHEFMGDLWTRVEPSPLRSIFYRAAEQLMAHLPFDRFVAVSEYTKRMIMKFDVPDERIDVIYHGGDTELSAPRREAQSVRAALGFSESDFVFLAYGRTGVSKGFEYLVEAMPLLLHSVPHARFVYVLTKYDRRVWRRIQRGLERVDAECYRLLSSVSREKLFDILHAVDCVVIPSLSEGFGLTALEACAVGKPVVSTSAGALPEVVCGRHVFVEPGSAVALADGLVRAADGAFENCDQKQFRWSETIEKYRRLYEELLG